MLPVSTSFAREGQIVPATASSRSRSRVVLVASADASLRERIGQSLTGLRWQVLEAPGGAEAWNAAQSAAHLEALVIDPWLPDLQVAEFLRDFRREFPQVDMMMTDGDGVPESGRSPYRQELLYALRRSHDGDTAIWRTAPEESSDVRELPPVSRMPYSPNVDQKRPDRDTAVAQSTATFRSNEEPQVPGRGESLGLALRTTELAASVSAPARAIVAGRNVAAVEPVPELVGASAAMLEVSRRIRLVAGRSTPVLIEGPTGSGKELVAQALHRLSSRSRKPFVAINCAAIPEALLEAELFGHTRGAFTGAVHGRTGRIESADGGTLFLDEIGEMPLALQAKLLRFFESGELQRIGDNETVKVDVRIIAATHQPLAENAQKGHFRSDLYFRLAVFLIHTPALAARMEDLPVLVQHFLEKMGRRAPVKRIDESAMEQLAAHHWPGNVRELEHVLERAAILGGEESVITASEIDFGLVLVH